MSPIINDLICQECGAHGDDIPFPVFPLTNHKFGEICADCETKIHNNKQGAK